MRLLRPAPSPGLIVCGFSDQIPQVASANGRAEGPPETQDRRGKAPGLEIVPAELFRRVFAQGIEGLAGFRDQARVGLRHRVVNRFAIDGCRAGIDETGNLMGAGGFQKVDVAPDILAEDDLGVVRKAPGQVDDDIHSLYSGADERGVRQIPAERISLPLHLFRTIKNPDAVPLSREILNEMLSDLPCTAGNEDLHEALPKEKRGTRSVTSMALFPSPVRLRLLPGQLAPLPQAAFEPSRAILFLMIGLKTQRAMAAAMRSNADEM